MTLLERIDADIITAQKAKEEIKLSTLRLLKNAIKNKEIELKKDADDNLAGEIIAKEIKTRKDSVEQYTAGERKDLADKENLEIEILKKYLPEQLSQEKITEIVQKAISKTQASGPQDMGKIMGIIMPEVKGKADGALVSRLVKENLAK